MTNPVNETSFVSGEISPSLFGRVDLARYHTAAATMRNMFPAIQGGAKSRAGTALVGISKQTGRSFQPWLIPFQFNITQGLALEFGNFYMRVVYRGAYVTENAIPITGATQASPAVISASASGGQTATANDGAISGSYAPGEKITLAGGTYTVPAVLNVNDTTLIGLTLSLSGTGYAPADTIHLGGGTQTTPAVVTVSSTKVVSAAIAAAGTGGTSGAQTVTGTTGTGTKFQANVTITGGSIVSVDSITVPGAYTVNPTSLAAEPVTGAGLTGATLSLTMGLLAFAITNGGVFTANSDGTFDQASTSGAGSGATFRFGLFAPNSLSFSTAGTYTAFPANPVAQASTTGSGAGATFTVTTGAVTPFQNGDWVFLSGIGGMTQLNNRTFVVGGATTTHYSLFDVYGNPIDSTNYSAYGSGGTAARIYTLSTPYAEEDLAYLKFVQSADTMTLTCLNQATGTEYIPADLARIADNDWTLNAAVKAYPNISPTQVSASASASGTTIYQYQVTSINPVDGSESAPLTTGFAVNAVDIASILGTISVFWSTYPGVAQYNIYKATPVPAGSSLAGSLFGYAGTSFGSSFVDTNDIPDFTQTPPTHRNPFSQGQVAGVRAISGGNGYTFASASLTSVAGSGALISPVIINGAVVSYYVLAPGQDYAPGDTITVAGDGAGALAALVLAGATGGTYPSVASYYQQRRVYAHSLLKPDTFWMSQPGAFSNFDSRIPTIDTDAITGTPWSTQVNGVQFMLPMPGGLVVLTGVGAWQLTGAGGSSLSPVSITPANQQAQPQAFNGCSPTIPPIKIDFDIIYVQALGSIYRDLSYQFFTNIYTGADLTQNSPHLFNGYEIVDHAWCAEPYKLLWSCRSDGVLLSQTYMKDQQVQGWSRHDTQGQFVSVCSITEPPVNAPYLAVLRVIDGNPTYFIERMDNRLWTSAETCWCVDCGVSLAQPEPNATLSASSAIGAGVVNGIENLVGGQNYSPLTVGIIEDIPDYDDEFEPAGAGAAVTLVIVGGRITSAVVGPGGSGYVRPQLRFSDPTGNGSGASADLTLDNSATFTSTADVFSPNSVGSVIRMGGGIATVTVYNGPQSVTAQITSPIVQTQPNDPLDTPIPQTSGNWTLTTPLMTVRGLYHLIGSTVTGLADGAVVTPRAVAADGSVTLDEPASSIILGLGFQAQFQTPYLDTGEPTVQGARKKIAAVTVRAEASRGLKMGANQVDGSTLIPPRIAPKWRNMEDVQDYLPPPFGGDVGPLWTGDIRVPVQGGYDTYGQVALQQDNPLPMNISAVIPEVLAGDKPEQAVRAKQ